MKKICAASGVEFEITNEDFKFYEKMGVPVPTLCPKERMKRRILWRNERSLYHRKCDHCNQSMISVYQGEQKNPIYCLSCWWGDSWTAGLYEMEFDFSLPFFTQFTNLMIRVPRQTLFQTGNNENSEYTNCSGYNKNCYLVYNCGYDEDVLFSRGMGYSKDCLDCYFGVENEICYELTGSNNCYGVQYSQNCKNCSTSAFLKNCIGCTDCFGCVNLRNKQYYFFNEKFSREEFNEKLLKINLYKNVSEWQEKFQEFIKKYPVKDAEIYFSENCCGDLIANSKNCYLAYEVSGCEDCRYLDCVKKCTDSSDVFGHGYHSVLLYEVVGTGHSHSLCFSVCTEVSSDSEYLLECDHVRHCFGCVGMRHAEYCILNKQYSKEEYFKLREKIIEHMKRTGEWGEFFPIELSPFAYNETVAQEYFPMTKEEVLKKEWEWHDDSMDKSRFVPSTNIISDNIVDIPDSICKEILVCESCDKNYKIQKAELKFYQKQEIPIPRKCPDCRHVERMKLRNPRKLWNRKCDQCSCEIQTTFAPNRPEKVYCEKCYIDCVE